MLIWVIAGFFALLAILILLELKENIIKTISGKDIQDKIEKIQKCVNSGIVVLIVSICMLPTPVAGLGVIGIIIALYFLYEGVSVLKGLWPPNYYEDKKKEILNSLRNASICILISFFCILAASDQTTINKTSIKYVTANYPGWVRTKPVKIKSTEKGNALQWERYEVLGVNSYFFYVKGDYLNKDGKRRSGKFWIGKGIVDIENE
jgi:hypothetical protein